MIDLQAYLLPYLKIRYVLLEFLFWDWFVVLCKNSFIGIEDFSVLAIDVVYAC